MHDLAGMDTASQTVLCFPIVIALGNYNCGQPPAWCKIGGATVGVTSEVQAPARPLLLGVTLLRQGVF